MSRTLRRLVLIALCAAGLLPATAAEAQWYGGAGRRPPPLYPYELQPGQSYAVEVAPGTYVIHRPGSQRANPHASPRVRSAARRHHAAPKPKRTHADRGLIEELRRRDARRTAKQKARAAKLAAQRAAKRAAKHTGRKPDQIIHAKRIVHEKPVVIETRRVVNDPPKVITRRHYVDDRPPPRKRSRHTGSIAGKQGGDDDPRVIHADAEITILGPDRMSIRLVRKDGQRLDADASAARAK